MKISKCKIMHLMAERRLTSKGLAQIIGIAPQNLSTILNRGYCKPITVARIAEGLGVAVAQITEED